MNSSEVGSIASEIMCFLSSTQVVDVVRLSPGCERTFCVRDGPALWVCLARRQMAVLRLSKVQQERLESQPHRSKNKIRLL